MKLNKVITKAGSELRTALEPLELTEQRRMLHKMRNTTDQTLDALQNTVIKYSVFSLSLQVRCDADRYRRSFLPTAITS